jgi:hypothetical protein
MKIFFLVASICSIWLAIKFIEGFIAGWKKAVEEDAEQSRTEVEMLKRYRQALIERYQRENIHDLDR